MRVVEPFQQRLFALPGSQYSDPEFSWRWAVAPAAIGFAGSGLGSQHANDLFVGAARIFLDQKNHRPLMLQYRGVAPQMRIQTQRVDGPPDPARIQRAEQAAAGAPAPLVDITLFLDDYKPVDGVLLPHHLSRSIDGKPTEEMTFKTIRINPAFKPDTFSAR